MANDDDTAALIAWAKDLLANATPGPWILDDTLVYALRSAGWRKGEELFENRFCAHIETPRTPREELRGTAALIAATPTLISALAAALERAQADAARMRGFGIPRSVRALAIAACDAVGLSSADDFDAAEQAIEMELDVHNISGGDVAIVVVARAALEPRHD